MTHNQAKKERGFSLIELLTVIAILTIVMGVVFREIIRVQQRFRTEEAKLDVFQEARNFMDRFVRDLHQAGYPGQRLYEPAAITMSPKINDRRVAAGLVLVRNTDLLFESDIDGDGQVDSIRYTLVTGTGGNCPCTIRRSQVIKINGTSPLSQPTNYFSIVGNIINSGGSGGSGPNGSRSICFPNPVGGGCSATSPFATATGVVQISNDTVYGPYRSLPVFQAFDRNGLAVTLPIDINTNPTALKNIRTIRVTMNVLATAPDPQTLMRPAVSLTASARVQNN
ncbi:MAG TPA: type II secretion system protein [Terriglobales bacterium]|nr:type II secretion system protein [Terriglobales bacterium]